MSYQASLIESNYGLGRLEGREEGMQAGMEAGLQAGKQEGKLEVARCLIEKGMSPEEAAEVAGISVELVRNNR